MCTPLSDQVISLVLMPTYAQQKACKTIQVIFKFTSIGLLAAENFQEELGVALIVRCDGVAASPFAGTSPTQAATVDVEIEDGVRVPYGRRTGRTSTGSHGGI